MRDARFTIPTPALLAKVVDLLEGIPMEDRDTKGDVYECMLGKIVTAGQNGQFRTPRHIIELMVMFHGYDFDNTMLRIGSMNTLLHGVENPAIA
jgi:type I restriction enzyme M protein